MNTECGGSPPLRRVRQLAAAVILLALLAIGCRTAQVRPPRNFGQVVDTAGQKMPVYRGGQPTCSEVEYLRSIGVKSILKLNDASSNVDSREKQCADKAGLTLLSFDFSARTIGKPETCDRVQSAIAFLENPDHWPVFVHCTVGKDRTGYIVGLYERLVLHKPEADVLEELKRYGHRGARSALFAQIDRELAKETPVCAPLTSSQ